MSLHTETYGETLPYDELPYEEQMAVPQTLKQRLGSKLYLYSDVSKSKKRARDDVEDEYNEEIVVTDGSRPNALFVAGTPISFLKTQAIFAYASHFDSTPTGLEWVDDISVVLVYPSSTRANQAVRTLRKSIAEEEDADGFVTAKPIPVDLWPADARIQIGLGVQASEKVIGMKGRIRMRKARTSDVKQKGARAASEFYRKHGDRAGKEMYEPPVPGNGPVQKRSRRDGESETWKRARLDAELDSIRDHNRDPTSSELTSQEMEMEDFLQDEPLASPSGLAGRIYAPIPRRSGGSSARGRTRKTQQELDDELDAFLKEKD